MSICFLLLTNFQHPSSHRRGGKFLELIPSLRFGIVLPRACMTTNVSSWPLVSFWVIWRVGWYGVKMGLYFFTHLSAGWTIWCPLRDVVCHGLTVSWLGRKEKKNNKALPKPAILCPCRVCGRACTEQRVCARRAQRCCTELEKKQAGHATFHAYSYPPLGADGSVG